MGVQGLWELLAPVGRRVSVETLAGKKLAIDASIWMIQFMKAMRDDKGEMVRNAHLLGFFRRICKLLFLRTKPVFVFDGGTPALKRRTVIARRRQRENAHAKIRKTAEKLLLNHLKAMKLKELADDIKSQRTKNVDKGKKVVGEQMEEAGHNAEGNDTVPSICNQEALDELLAASLAAEEDEGFISNASTSDVGIPSEEEDDDEDEEMIFPAMNGKVDPAVLAALPPSMQLDLLVQMRERLMAENRQKYQKVKKAPSKFSELQIQSYLKTVAFRREIDEVQKSAAGKGVGGVQTSRIASEAHREFIFSSSFTGNKEVLTSVGVERHGEKLHQKPSESPPLESLSSTASRKKDNAETGPLAGDPGAGFNSDIMTYMDERGRVRVSKVRAMGIHMTRDLQRNLDLMKEIEQVGMSTNETANSEFILDKNAGGVSKKFPDKIQLRETSDDNALVHLDCRNDESTTKNSNSMEISFEDDGGRKRLDDDDQLFASLVAGDPVTVSSADNSPSKKHPSSSNSSFEWEEGIIEYNGKKDDGLAPANEMESRLPLAEEGSNDDDEVEWEDGGSDVFKDANSVLAETGKTSLKGDWKEEAELQEAIKRSLEDFKGQQSNDASFADNKLKNAREVDCETASIGSFLEGNSKAECYVPYGDVVQADKSSNGITGEVEKLDSGDNMDAVNTDDSPTGQLSQSIEFNPDRKEETMNKPQEKYPNSCDGLSLHDTNDVGNLLGDVRCKKTGINTACQVSTHADTSSIVSSKISDSLLNTTPDVVLSDAQQNVTEVAQATGVAELGDSSITESTAFRMVLETAKAKMELGQSSLRDLTTEQEVVKNDRAYEYIVQLSGDEVEGIALKDGKEHPIELTEASLEEEMLNLTKECTDLGVEQRRLERNAESVSGEMFAECQELLQMFGLPYIIAPMEAEAQCAYMELVNLVDGVVTDDSDAFLFGARSVYKNIFDDRKYVETYFMKDIENEFGLTREKLIRMALLLGSDYTEGVSGIGIVNAIEVVNAFPEEDGLSKFREWIESPDPTILGKLDVHIGSRRRGSKVGSSSNKEDFSATGQTDAPSMHCIDEKKQIFMDKHRNVSKNWHIPLSFPSEAVISAYAAPQVDKSTEPFSWGKPDHLVLRRLCWEKFGWSSQKADELLLPVLKEYNKHETQLRLEAFYTFNERFAKIRSKRIKKAVRGITGNASSELMDDIRQEASKGRKKRRIGASECGEDKLEKSASEMEDCDAIEGGESTQRTIAMQSRNEKHVETRPSEGEDPKQESNQGSIERGDQAVGRGRRKRYRGHRVENSSEDGDNSDYEQEIQLKKLGGCQGGVRKSTRTRKAVKYTFDDLEVSEPSEPAEGGDNCNHEEAVQEEEPSKDCGWFGNAAANVGDKNQGQVGGLSFERCPGMDEAEPDLETGQLNLHRHVDLSFEAEASKEYLRMGGGFCLNEDDGINDIDKRASEPDKASVSDDANAHSSDVITKVDPETGSVQHIYSPVRDLEGFQDSSKTDAVDRQNLARSTPITSEDPSGSVLSPGTSVKTGDSGAAAVNSLSAMPNLRRKRRKH